MRQIELLAPAKNLECGISAINAGADAVYIGGPAFGARKNAGNAIADIEKLIQYARLYDVKTYITLNTLLFDNELVAVEKLIHQYYNAGADAIIIQDMGILELNLPPIALHASTQTNNRSVEKVQFLEKVGFDQVVLARELSLQQIKEISSQTNVKLEMFVHGALCVSYSGQCYMSQAINSRSANRGDCAQPCRLPYQLTDKEGNVLEKEKHLMSLKDLNLSEYLEEIIDAGVYSLKIEGRLKDKEYVQNIVSHYRQKLDEIFRRRPDLCKASIGESNYSFEPNPEKSFNRGFTDYFLNGRHLGIWNTETPKSLGEKIGKVIKIEHKQIIVDTDKIIANGDGLCFFDRTKTLSGVRVNMANGNKLELNTLDNMYTGATLFRNHDQQFSSELNNDKGERKIKVKIIFSENDNGFSITISDESGLTTTTQFDYEKEKAQNRENAYNTLRTQLSKLGNTPFESNEIDLNLSDAWFFPNSVINYMRREAIEKHQLTRLQQYQRIEKKIESTNHLFTSAFKSFENNIVNQKAEAFYKRHGVTQIEKGFELQSNYKNKKVMTTKHCILYQMDLCKKNNPNINEPLFLTNAKKDVYQLEFDCKNCEMNLILHKQEAHS